MVYLKSRTNCLNNGNNFIILIDSIQDFDISCISYIIVYSIICIKMDKDLLLSAVEKWINEMESWGESTDKEFWKLAVELWKIEKKFQKCKEKLSEEENKSFDFLFNRVNQIFENNKVKVTDFTNEKWNEWMALLDIIAVEECDGLEFPVIWETISPLIEVNWNTVQRSKVIIYKPKQKEIIEIIDMIPKKKLLWLWLTSILLLILLIILISLLFHKSSNNETNILEEKENGIESVSTIEENNEEINDINIDENIEEVKEEVAEELNDGINQEIIEEDNIETVEVIEENNEQIETNQNIVE